MSEKGREIIDADVPPIAILCKNCAGRGAFAAVIRRGDAGRSWRIAGTEHRQTNQSDTIYVFEPI